MQPLPFTNLAQQFKPRYRWPATFLVLAGIAASFVPTSVFGFWLAHALHLQIHAPVKEQQNGGLWFALFLTFTAVSILAGYLGSFVVLAAILRYVYGWTPARIRALIFESDVPPHWFKRHPEA